MTSGAVRKQGFLYDLLITYIFFPFINRTSRFLKSIVDKSSEALHLHITPTGHGNKYGRGGKRKAVTMFIDNPIHFCWLMILDEKMGLGEAYMAGDWRAEPNPTEFLKLLIRAKKETAAGKKPSNKGNRTLAVVAMGCALNVLRRAVAIYTYIQHRIRDNTMKQSAKNIEEHYDLGNDMFELFLDKTMTYSCAFWEEPGHHVKKVDFEELEKAQLRKIDALIDMLDLKETDSVLEIGCGWGAFAIRGVQRSGCKWTGLTISHEQLALGKERVKAAGLEDKIDLKYQDYRLAGGQYTRVISVEMIEAVGHAFLPQYFQIISDRLASGGKAVLQAITCPDAYYAKYCKSSDFIKKYIFPGGHMPSLGAIHAALPSDLQFGEKRHIGRHYATTLDHWYSAWMVCEKDILALGYSESFHRRWQYYFCLCSSLFANDHIDTVQFELNKC
ncbi:Cyclopropane-fatty-acyl-phospholipid synthase [Ancylostoma caninum]|uniref:Cyclopropane-fatty-acyl-phospholipid synthase n=1 Tax=Ancylostoma caninum TaxID=29170 RepID=A0A368FY30_ANCCA|nr:Cyclopropane-fatty-acyl-phospholipid synthase [Ancylostoma caninum]